jgi:hypothetical protein
MICISRRTLSEMLWLSAFGALAQLLTGANLAWRGDAHYLIGVSEYGRFAGYLLSLGMLNLLFAHDLGGRAFGKILQRGCGVVLLVVAALLATSPASWLVWFVPPACVAWLLATALWLRPGPEWATLERAGIGVLLGLLLFDLAFDGPFLLFGGEAALRLSLLNNATQHGSLIDVLWVPVVMLVVAGTVIRGCVIERTRYDFALLGLFATGGLLLTSLIDPLEAELTGLAAGSPRVATVITSIGLSHAASVAVIGIALGLLAAKARRRGPNATVSPTHR